MLSKPEAYTQMRKSLEKLHIVGVTDGFIESLDSIQVSLIRQPLRMDVVLDNFPILQEGILETDFLKDSAPIDPIRCAGIRKMA